MNFSIEEYDERLKKTRKAMNRRTFLMAKGDFSGKWVMGKISEVLKVTAHGSSSVRAHDPLLKILQQDRSIHTKSGLTWQA